jgi:hypothetical protein
MKDISRREFAILISLLIPTVLLGIFPNIILETLHVSVTQLLYNITPIPNSNIYFSQLSELTILNLSILANIKNKKLKISKITPITSCKDIVI